jgi:hypothetical protein
MQASPADVEEFVTSLRRTLGPPWTADHRRALAAAIGTLRRHK